MWLTAGLTVTSDGTAQRPVTSGAVSVKKTLAVGAVLALVALALVLTTNAATVAWAVRRWLAYPYADGWWPCRRRYWALPSVLGRHPHGVYRHQR